MALLTQRYRGKISGQLSCFDRMLITGILQQINFGEGFSRYLFGRGIRMVEYKNTLAKPLRDKIVSNAERIAEENGLEIEYISSPRGFRKEERIQEVLRERGEHPGLAHIFKVMETCPCFEAVFDRNTRKTHFAYRDAKCIHFYFYFIDPEFGLCYFRVPTWAPYRVQFYCNGHNWVANQLRKEGISFTQLDNTLIKIGDFEKAQAIADRFSPKMLEPLLNRYASLFCPVAADLELSYWWTLTQLEYATDIVFKRRRDLAPIYETLVATAIHSVKPDHVSTFLSRQITYNCNQEIGNDFHTRIEGTVIKHHMGSAAIKMYDKHQLVLRVETTVNNVSFFKHLREVQHRDGTVDKAVAPVKKTIYSLGVMRGFMAAANHRYLEFVSELADPSAGISAVKKLSEPVRKAGRPYRGFNMFDPKDLNIFLALAHGELNISGFRNSTIRRILKDRTGPQVSRILKRLHLHGIIKTVGRTYKYYLSKLGQRALLTALKLRDMVVIPSMAQLEPV